MLRKIWSRIKIFFSDEKKEFNALYFFIFFALILAMTVSHFYFWETSLEKIPLFFLAQAFGQVLMETGLFFLAGAALHRWTPRWLFLGFIAFSFLILLLHFVDFTIIRLMDASISYMFTYLFGAGISNLVTSFQAMNLNAQFFFIALLILCLLPMLGIGLYRITQPLAKKFSHKIAFSHVAIALSATCALLLALDLIFHPIMSRIAYAKFQKTLPLGTTFIRPQKQYIQADPIAAPKSEGAIEAILKEKSFAARKMPNLYLFIIETLRSDFITEQTAPNLHCFAHENLCSAESFSNANGTHLSWFAILHSMYPYHWTAMRQERRQGSVPLQILKQLGYQINVYTSSDLRLFNIDRLLFGQHRELIDRIFDYTEDRNLTPAERDKSCVEQFCNDLAKDKQHFGNLFLFFLDATHSEYSTPADFPLKFVPIIEKIDYLTLTPKELEPLKNRYRNAICYVDQLFGKCMDRLREHKLFDEAIIVVTGDHGEEFFEEGALFHGTHLNRYQTAVPLYYKFQSNPWSMQGTFTTHLDILPSMLHYLTGRCDFLDLFDGQSIFDPNRWPYRLAVLQNGPETPVEFTIQNQAHRFHLRFLNPLNIYEGASFEMLSFLDQEEDFTEAIAPLLMKIDL